MADKVKKAEVAERSVIAEKAEWTERIVNQEQNVMIEFPTKKAELEERNEPRESRRYRRFSEIKCPERFFYCPHCKEIFIDDLTMRMVGNYCCPNEVCLMDHWVLCPMERPDV